jgi:hypothetical protein
MATDDNTTERQGPGAGSPSTEELEAENPVESPAQPDERQGDAQRGTAQERASYSTESERQAAKSTEGLTVGGEEKTPAH